ncbi:hypothetical protein COLO4_28181 [Corchorus olitorius]|uniref:F-box domain-containing protein n=1 Tax=Corchorus olitorius TaxID=93759 RepID=A0A1R3HMJ6_9ROSI|nr:hypothetical protein COLO4_28181 [Corchorus olitorius]
MSCSFDLPQDLFVEVLVRLSIQDVVKCTAVCKSWNSNIKNPTFISAHLSLKKTISFYSCLLLFRLCTTQAKPGSTSPECVEHYSLRFDNEKVDEYKKLHFPANEFQSTGRCFRVAGSYNGLVCLVDDQMGPYRDNFILWNPSIRKAVRTARPTVTFFSHGPFEAFVGFGFDSETSDYRLLRFVQLILDDYKICIEVEVYSLNLNRWKSITDIAPNYCVSIPMRKTYGHSFVNGAIHLLAYDRKGNQGRIVVLAFDVSREVFSEMALPDFLSNDYKRLVDSEILIYGQSSIAVLTDDYHKMYLWVMKEYGVSSSWTKVLVGAGERVPRVLFFRKEEEVFLITDLGGRIASFDIKSQHFKNVVFDSLNLSSIDSILTGKMYPVVDSFAESLVLLDKGTPFCYVIDESGGTEAPLPLMEVLCG